MGDAGQGQETAPEFHVDPELKEQATEALKNVLVYAGYSVIPFEKGWNYVVTQCVQHSRY